MRKNFFDFSVFFGHLATFFHSREKELELRRSWAGSGSPRGTRQGHSPPETEEKLLENPGISSFFPNALLQLEWKPALPVLTGTCSPAHLPFRGITTGSHSCWDFQWVPQTDLTPLDLHKMLPLSAGVRNSALGLCSLHCRTDMASHRLNFFNFSFLLMLLVSYDYFNFIRTCVILSTSGGM